MPSQQSSRRAPARGAARSTRDRPVVGVRELRQNLSVYLDRVKRGAVFQVTEHGHVVATLQPAAAAVTRLERLEAQGLVTPARRAIREVAAPRPAPQGSPASAAALDDLGRDRI